MAIEMIPNSRLGQEAVTLKTDAGLKEGNPDKAGDAPKIKEGNQTGEAVKRGVPAAPESAGAVKAAGEAGGMVRVSQVHKGADTGQITEADKAGKIKGGTVRNRSLDQYIPEEKAEAFGHYKAMPDGKGNSKIQFDRPNQSSGETAEGELTKDSATGKDGVKKAGSGTKGADGQSGKIEKLKMKKRQLKEQIKAETDPKKAGELKRKLAKVERELKGKGGMTF